MKEKLLIVKMGGAAITDKNNEFTAKSGIISSILDQLKHYDGNLIIVHGAGSFGHNLAKKYRITHGVTDDPKDLNQYLGVTKIRNSMQRLHQIILDIAEDRELKTFSIPISSTLITDGQEEIDSMFYEVYERALNHSLIPITFGDVVFDSSSAQFLIVSGDRIIKLLAERLDQYEIRVIFGSDVDGLFDKNPKNSDASLIRNITFDEIDNWISVAGESAGVDVTGGMAGKLRKIKKISQFVTRIDLINFTKPGRLQKLLADKETIGTKFYRE